MVILAMCCVATGHGPALTAEAALAQMNGSKAQDGLQGSVSLLIVASPKATIYCIVQHQTTLFCGNLAPNNPQMTAYKVALTCGDSFECFGEDLWQPIPNDRLLGVSEMPRTLRCRN